MKIDSIIAKGVPHPDPDAPEDPESVRFWATSGGSMAERERTKITASAQATLESTADGLASIVGGLETADMASGAGKPAGGPSLRALVDIASAPDPKAAPAAKAKGKAKAKAKVRAQAPKTPAEMRNSIRHLSNMEKPDEKWKRKYI